MKDPSEETGELIAIGCLIAVAFAILIPIIVLLWRWALWAL